MSVPALIRLTGWLIILLIVVGLAALAGPQIEGSLFQVIDATHIAGSVIRSPQELCWSTRFEKFRNLEPSYFNYRIRYTRTIMGDDHKPIATTDRIPIGAYRVNDAGQRVYLSTAGFSNHPAGAAWTSQYCADMPRDIDLSHAFIVEGEGFYSSWLWFVPQPLPSFEVPAN